VIGSNSGASEEAQLAYDHATDRHWASKVPQLTSAHAAPVAKVENVKKVELSHKDIDLLAKELYKEATADNRDVAESAAKTRQAQIRHAVAAAVMQPSATHSAVNAASSSPSFDSTMARSVVGGRGRVGVGGGGSAVVTSRRVQVCV
jgi:hypothetical protein